jgi:putative NIF3 family GTP cyclohydrolase 1 type 2
LIICHELAFYPELPQPHPYRWTSDPAEMPYELEDHPNQRIRKKLLNSKPGIIVLQMHYLLDRFCIQHAFVEAADLGRCVVDAGYESVYQLDVPITVKQLARKLSECLGLEGIRIAGDPEKIVTKAGSLWGGVGLSSNRYWMRKQIEHGAEVLIAGESDELAMCFAIDSGVPMIITSHVMSENFGIKKFALFLASHSNGVAVEFYEIPCPFKDVQDLI